jgi:hypothetical protein
MGKKAGPACLQTARLELDHVPMSDYTIGIDTIENMVANLQVPGWPIYKIKLVRPMI